MTSRTYCSRKTLHALLVVGLTFVVLCFSASAMAQVPYVRAVDQLPAMAFYQLDGQAFWRLSNHVLTAEGGATPDPRPVYVQFGSVSCEPCHALAAWINERLPDAVLRVYAHIDEVELAENAMPLGRLRRDLQAQMSADEDYSTFLPLVAVPLSLVQALTGSDSLPGGLLILPDGRHVSFSGFDTAQAERVVAWFEQEWSTYE